MSNLSSQGASRGSDYKCKRLEQPLLRFVLIGFLTLLSLLASPQPLRVKVRRNRVRQSPRMQVRYSPTKNGTLSKVTSCSVVHHPALASGKPFMLFIASTFIVTYVIEIWGS